jgi:uncharacterized protein YukE
VTSVWLPEVVGDPAGMRTLAASLRSDASALASLASDLAGEIASMTFEGPAATEFRERTRARQTRLTDYAGRLLDVASLLETSATEVEAAQRERERRLAELREAEREAELRQKQAAGDGVR